MNKISVINEKIEKLRKQKTRVQLQEAVLFKREAEKIFDKVFSPDLALAVMTDWSTATESKKKEWTNKSNSFRPVFFPEAQQKSMPRESTLQQNGKETADKNG